MKGCSLIRKVRWAWLRVESAGNWSSQSRDNFSRLILSVYMSESSITELLLPNQIGEVPTKRRAHFILNIEREN